MTYDALNTSVEGSQPSYRFLFQIGAVEYRYTNLPVFTGDSAGTWEPAQITGSNITSTNELAKNGVRLSMPRTIGIAQQFLGGVPEDACTLTIFRDQGRGDADSNLQSRVYWKGRVVGSATDGDEVTLDCEDVWTSFARAGLRMRYQKSCRHALYGAGCGLDRSEWGIVCEGWAQAGKILTLDDAQDDSAPGDSVGQSLQGFVEGYFTGGYVETSTGITRAIIATISRTEFQLLTPFRSEDLQDSAVTSITIYPGCRRTILECRDKFDNVLNYGGFAHIPVKNPFGNNVTGSIQ